MVNNMEWKRFLIIRCPRCKAVQGHQLLKLKNRKTQPHFHCTRCGANLPIKRAIVLAGTNDARVAQHLIVEIKKVEAELESKVKVNIMHPIKVLKLVLKKRHECLEKLNRGKKRYV